MSPHVNGVLRIGKLKGVMLSSLTADTVDSIPINQKSRWIGEPLILKKLWLLVALVWINRAG